MTRGGWDADRERRLLLAVIASNEGIRYNCDHIGALCGETRDAVGHKLRSMKDTIKEMRKNKAAGLIPDTAPLPTPSKKRKSTSSPTPKKTITNGDSITVKRNGSGSTNGEPLAKKFKRMKEEDDNEEIKEVPSDNGSEPSMSDLGSETESEYETKDFLKEESPTKRLPTRRAAPVRGAFKEEETSDDELYG